MKNISNFVNTHAPTPKNLKERKGELNLKKKMQEKVESPLPTMKLGTNYNRVQTTRRTRQRQHDDDFVTELDRL